MSIDNRDQAGTADVIALNGFYDLLQNKSSREAKYHFVKRDGTELYPVTLTGTEIRGIHFWEDQDKLLVAYDTKIEVITASTGVSVTTLTPFVSTTGEVGFTEFQYADGSVKVVACDGSRLITIDTSNVVVTGSDPDQPTTMKPNIVYIDGYIFVIKAGTSDIYNSNLDNPLAFTAGDFITAEMLPDSLIRIARLRNYLVAFGSASIEYFYNAANASGSPLNRNDTPLKQVGLLGGMAFYGSQIYFVGQHETTGPEVMMLEDFKLEQISSPPLRRYIQPDRTFKAVVMTMGGRDFYVLNVGDITYMMDLATQLWTRLAFKNTTEFPVSFATQVVRNGIGNTSIFALEGSMQLHVFNPDVYQDAGTPFTVKLQTDPEMFDTIHNKFMSRLLVVCDRPRVNAILNISYTDDDYQTYSTPRPVNLNVDRPTLNRLGKFRRRAFVATFTENAPMRLKHFEVDFNIGAR